MDLLLNATGLRQAYAAAVYLKDHEMAAIYSSPLKRTMETAKVIANQKGLPVYPFDGLIDIDFGEWQGLSPEEAEARDGDLYLTWLNRPHEMRFPGGERLADVRERVTSAVEKLATKHPEETVALVSHMVVCRVLLCAMLGLDNSHYWQVGQDVCAINTFEIRDGAPSVLLINETCHLKGLATR
jgi:probable phosphoglycerate mutase